MYYGRHENPYSVERMLWEAQNDFENLKALCNEDASYSDLLASVTKEISKLEKRVKIAWEEDKELWEEGK